MRHKKVKAGIIGCGAISPAYFKGCPAFEILDIVACADLDLEKAKARASEFNVPKVYTVKELLDDPEIELVVNLTIPKAHVQVDIAALEAGKHIFSEKPFSLNRVEGKKVLDLAASKKLLVGCAPDTFLSGGAQTCRKLIADGWIGTPIGAAAFMTCHGHESWHPSPEFYYEAGGGPMFDMGPYYLTALINLLGPVKRVSGATKVSFPERKITSQPKFGKMIKVEVPTHINGIMEFANGVVGTVLMSFDVWKAQLPYIEIYGTQGTLSTPDPNCTGGVVHVFRHDSKDWTQIPLTHPYGNDAYSGYGRGIGVADLAYAIRTGRPVRPNGQLAFHVVDIMESVHDAARKDKYIDLTTTCLQPDPLPLGLTFGQLDE
ncbi:MAG: Gfo/Idh/MocA family oxidoreductase [Phycisphaerae bacterium]|nr:Gfo/Idh/MocA family oxidoreductase [Phycisphaerae bacterium]